MITRRQANIALLSTMVAAAVPAVAQEQAKVLPPPQTEGGMPLMQALKARHSTRDFADRPLPPQLLSNLLWAAWGINRPANNYRTAPSSRSTMDIDLYLAMADGVWIYDPKAHRLVAHLPDDVRAETTLGQDFVKTAPLNIIYVSDAARMGKPSDADRMLNGIADSAVIGENVYLFCASEGLASVFRAAIDYKKLAKAMQLEGEQFVTFAQTVGYPKI